MRNRVFDIIRGFAILFMVMANAAPLFKGTFPLILRVLFSLPAPTFVFVSGLMLAIVRKKHEYFYFIKKSVFIIVIAALVDTFSNNLVPFQGFDVLYLIGFSLPVIALTLQLENKYIYIIVALIFIASELLRHYCGYAQEPSINDMTHSHLLTLLQEGPPFKNWFIDGWFPFFPWSGIMLLGGLIGKLYVENNHSHFFQSKIFLSKLAIVLSIAIVAFMIMPTPKMYTRGGYVEIFYPAHLSIMFSTISFSMVMLVVSERIQKIEFLNNSLGSLGKSTMSLYIFHLTAISFVIKPLAGDMFSLDLYFMFFVLLIILVFLFAYFLNHIKSTYHNPPVMLSWLIGK